MCKLLIKSNFSSFQWYLTRVTGVTHDWVHCVWRQQCQVTLFASFGEWIKDCHECFHSCHGWSGSWFKNGRFILHFMHVLQVLVNGWKNEWMFYFDATHNWVFVSEHDQFEAVLQALIVVMVVTLKWVYFTQQNGSTYNWTANFCSNKISWDWKLATNPSSLQRTLPRSRTPINKDNMGKC